MVMQAKGVTIAPYGDGWRATVPVLNPALARLDGVAGKASAGGPWIGGEGVTPDDALNELHVAIGRVMLPALLSESAGKGEP